MHANFQIHSDCPQFFKKLRQQLESCCRSSLHGAHNASVNTNWQRPLHRRTFMSTHSFGQMRRRYNALCSCCCAVVHKKRPSHQCALWLTWTQCKKIFSVTSSVYEPSRAKRMKSHILIFSPTPMFIFCRNHRLLPHSQEKKINGCLDCAAFRELYASKEEEKKQNITASIWSEQVRELLAQCNINSSL